MKNGFLLVLLLITLTQCTKNEDIPSIKTFQVFVIQGVSNATLIWDAVDGFDDPAQEYFLYLDDSLIAGHILKRRYALGGLKENSEYKGKIEAYAGNRQIAVQPFIFTTLKDQPPQEFSITEIAIKNNSVTLKWEKAYDPENTAVVYDIYFNKQLKASGVNELAYEVQGLNPSTQYNCEVVARDSAGNTRITTLQCKTINTVNSILVHLYFKYQGNERDFAWYLPANYNPAQAVPLVIFLHGANGNAWNDIGTSYFKTIADRENFIFAMPQALLGSYNGETIYQWNAHYIFNWDDVSFLNYLIDFMNTKYSVDLSKVYISGMSNGGFMTFFAARGLQDRLAAVAPISGLISSNVFVNYKLDRPLPLCYMHGTADNIVRIDGNPSAETILSFWAKNNNCLGAPIVNPLPDISKTDNSTVTMYQYKGYLPDSEIQYYKIIDGGHSIPGNEPGANMDINAFEVIWSFFSRHSYPQHSMGKTILID